ncbi:SLAM family member 5-like isoform X1 [Acipenser ruthenus]|uniref:SLAM family member 5-like isoform X1 n=1 Tax=Acipenser ruthenus TaxID=7906 RepID=UPI002740EE02|nr:SLAM family member 5-like isoform X1 [Acipenser ruthenus]
MGDRWRGVCLLCASCFWASHVSTAQLVTQQVNGIVGESLTFPMEIPNLQPDTEVYWRYGPVEPDSVIAKIQNGKIKVFDKRFKARLQLDNMSSSLRINGLQTADRGIYQVEEIEENGFKKRFHLSVYSQPSSAAQLGGQQVKGIVGESFTFPVEIANLQLDIEVHWRYGPAGPDRPIARLQEGKIKTDFIERFKSRLQLNMNTGSLQIHHLNTEDRGIYQVETVRDIFHKRFYLSVYNPVPEPQVLQIHSANRSCTLQCFVGNASEVNVSWIRDGKPLNTTELEISQEMQGGNVTYSCVASNPASNKSITVTPSHYCGKRNGNEDGAETPRNHVLIPVIVLAVIGVLAVLSITLYLRRKKTAFEKEGSERSRNSSGIVYAEVTTAPPAGSGEDIPELAAARQTTAKLTTIYDELRTPSSQNAPC